MTTPNWLEAAEPRIIRYPSRAAWVAARSTVDPEVGPTLGASDLAILFGDATYATPGDIVAQKKRGRNKPQTESMRRGRLAESLVLALYGASEWPQTDVVRHPTVPWLRATPDGITAARPVEAKFPHDPREWSPATLRSAAEWERGICPLGHYVQVQAQIACLGCDSIDLIAGVGRWGDIVCVQIHADRVWFSELLSVASRWRDRYLIGDAVPLDLAPEIEDFIRIERSNNKRPREATESEAAAIEQIIECRRAVSRLDVEKAAAEAVLLQSADKRLRSDLASVTIYESGERESIKLSALRDSDPALYRELVAGGHINTSSTSTVVGVYPKKTKE